MMVPDYRDALNSAVAAALLYIGLQFKKNRGSGAKRDEVVERLVSRMDDVARKVDEDRLETRFLQERARTLEEKVHEVLLSRGKNGGT